MSMEHLLQGLLQKPVSGYDLKAGFDGTSRHFWAAERSQIHVTLQRMERRGLRMSRSEPSPEGPDRQVYSLTPAGHEKLEGWLAAAPKFDDGLHQYLNLRSGIRTMTARVWWCDEVIERL